MMKFKCTIVDVFLAERALRLTLRALPTLKFMVSHDVIVQGESDVVRAVDALREARGESTPMGTIFTLHLKVELVDQEEHLYHLLVFHMFIVLCFEFLKTLRAHFFTVGHDLVDTIFAVDS